MIETHANVVKTNFCQLSDEKNASIYLQGKYMYNGLMGIGAITLVWKKVQDYSALYIWL